MKLSKKDKLIKKLLQKKTLKDKEVARLLELKNLEGNKKTGSSHQQFTDPITKSKITVPVHGKELKTKTLNSILKQAGLK